MLVRVLVLVDMEADLEEVQLKNGMPGKIKVG